MTSFSKGKKIIVQTFQPAPQTQQEFSHSPLTVALRYTLSITTTANFNGKISKMCYSSNTSCPHPPHQLPSKFHEFYKFTIVSGLSRNFLKQRAHTPFQKYKGKLNSDKNFYWEIKCVDRSGTSLSFTCGVTWLWNSWYQHIFTWFQCKTIRHLVSKTSYLTCWASYL